MPGCFIPQLKLVELSNSITSFVSPACCRSTGAINNRLRHPSDIRWHDLTVGAAHGVNRVHARQTR